MECYIYSKNKFYFPLTITGSLYDKIITELFCVIDNACYKFVVKKINFTCVCDFLHRNVPKMSNNKTKTS